MSMMLAPLDTLRDDVFLSLGYTAERMALLRNTINQAGPTPITEELLADEDARSHRLVDLGLLLDRLIPHQAEFSAKVVEILAGERRMQVV